ncbi:Ring finger domain [seawater metagenome]|uniref:Ring finger domain n=1 Tax=seawater metagenome TaxID=1561972 RepID=A0A5E8CHB1_9ZZZZ
MIIIPEIKYRFKKNKTIIIGFNEINVIETIKKTKEKKNKYLEMECSICTEKIINEEKEVIILECKHVFHQKCLNTWKTINQSCPLCRQEIKDVSLLEFT